MRVTLKNNNGFSLIEVLVTVIILTVGFLGLAAVQLLGSKNISHSNNRTLATLYVNDMAERMRANRIGLGQGHYNGLTTTDTEDPSCNNFCIPSDMASRDVYEWGQQLSTTPVLGGLPEGKGAISFAQGIHTISITWQETSVVDGETIGAEQRFSVALRL